MSQYEILGWLNVIIFVLLVIKVPLKAINRKLRNRSLAKVNGLLTKYHKYLGILMIVLIVCHGVSTGANIFEINSGTLILITVLLTAISGFMIKIVRKKFVLIIHKFLSLVVAALIINHIFL